MTCPTCHLSYCDDVPEDRRQHRTRHERYLVAASEGVAPRAHAALEEAKAEAWGRLTRATRDLERLDAMQTVCRSHWERSIAVQVAGGPSAWRRHPDFAAYACGYDAEHVFGKDAPVFRKAHPRRLVPGMKPGMSYWDAPTARA